MVGREVGVGVNGRIVGDGVDGRIVGVGGRVVSGSIVVVGTASKSMAVGNIKPALA